MTRYFLALCAFVALACVAAATPNDIWLQIEGTGGTGKTKPLMIRLTPGMGLIGGASNLPTAADIATQTELNVVSASDALKAPIASPTFTGIPAGPTAAAGTSTTQLATTAFTTNAIAVEAALRVLADAQKADLDHVHNSTEITDMTDMGRLVIRVNSAEALKALIAATTTSFSVSQRIRINSGSNQCLFLQRTDTGYYLECDNGAGDAQFAIKEDGSLVWFDGTVIVTRPAAAGALVTSGSTLDATKLSGALPALNGSALTSLNASNLASGTVANARLDADLQVLAGITYSADVQALLDADDNEAAKVLLTLGATSTPNFLGANLSSGLLTHSGELRIPSTPISSGVIDVTKREQTLTLTGTTTTLTLSSGTHQAGRFFTFELKGSASGENTVTLDLTPDMISMDTRLGASVTQFVVPGSPAYVRCTIKDDGTNYLLYNDPGMNTGTVSIPTSRTTYVDGAETTVASATTTDLGAVASDHVSITGTTTITSFGTCTAGVERSGVFTGALTLTHNGTSLILPWGANITTVAGDTFRAVSLGSGNWRVYSYAASSAKGTVDADAVVLKLYSDIQFATPAQCDNTGAVRVTTEGATYGHATFSNSADKAGNYVIYRCLVPSDLDTSVDLTAQFTQRLTGADTGKQAYEISMADVNSSGGADAPTFTNAVAINFAGDASGASGDIEISAATTLTSWRSSLTAGHFLVIKLARDGDDATNDTSTVNSNDMNLTIRYKRTQ